MALTDLGLRSSVSLVFGSRLARFGSLLVRIDSSLVRFGSVWARLSYSFFDAPGISIIILGISRNSQGIYLNLTDFPNIYLNFQDVR